MKFLFMKTAIYVLLLLFAISCDSLHHKDVVHNEKEKSINNDRIDFDENKVMITLSSIILTTTGLDPHLEDTIKGYLERKELDTKGDWELVWLDQGTTLFNDKTTACIVKHKRLKNTLAVVSQGADLLSVEEWYNILDIYKTVQYPYSSCGNYPIAKGFKVLLDSFEGLRSYSDLSPSIKTSPFEYLEEYCSNRGGEKINLYLTGHSLGGTLTTGIAPKCIEIVERYGNSDSKVSVWTYAEPSLYSQAFVNYFTSLMENKKLNFSYRRYFIGRDLVPTLYAWNLRKIGELDYPIKIFLYYRLRFLSHLMTGLLRVKHIEYAELGTQKDSFVYEIKNLAKKDYFKVPSILTTFKNMEEYSAWNHDHKSYMLSLGAKCIPVTTKSNICPLPQIQ